MSVIVQDAPFRVPGYTGYVPGLKYSFGHTYGYSESQLFKSQHPSPAGLASTLEKLRPYHSPLRSRSNARVAHNDPCIEGDALHRRISRDVVQPPPRRVQWNDGDEGPDPGAMDSLELDGGGEQEDATTQCEKLDRDLRSAATQWSDQEKHRKKKWSAGTQWSPADFSPLKTISGYTGHLPGRSYVSPGKTFCQEMNALLTTFHPKSTAVLPMSRHNFTSALQQTTQNSSDVKNDPYFDNRPPSTYANNYPIPGYQGFVPRVRTSTSSLGIRYIKAVENSLHAMHEKNRKGHENIGHEEIANSPNKLLDKRPLHTPRHKPHPKQQLSEEDDWRLVYRRPPSTYMDSRTYIPGYKGFIPHLRGSPTAVGVRYSKAAIKCVEASEREDGRFQERCEVPAPEEDAVQIDGEDVSNEDSNAEEQNEAVMDSDKDDDAETQTTDPTDSNRLQRNVSSERPKRQQHALRLNERKPSTYQSDERYPIPGYQGFVPRMRDSPTTLGLRYTKAAFKTLEDVHRKQQEGYAVT